MQRHVRHHSSRDSTYVVPRQRLSQLDRRGTRKRRQATDGSCCRDRTKPYTRQSPIARATANIRELEKGNPARTGKGTYTGFSCNYSLGDGIFGELREHYGNQEFNARIAGLAKRHEKPRLPGTDGKRRQKSPGRRRAGVDDHRNVVQRPAGDAQVQASRHGWSGYIPQRPTAEWLHFHGRIHGGGIVHEPTLGKDPFCSQFALYTTEPETQNGSAASKIRYPSAGATMKTQR